MKVALEDFRLETFPGGARERDFISLVRFQEAGRWTGIHKIHSNNPGFHAAGGFPIHLGPSDPASGYRGMNFTGLGVGNRHGVWVMLCGGVMTVLGTIWAFYIKPLILKRRSVRRAARKITGSVAAGLSFLILAPCGHGGRKLGSFGGAGVYQSYKPGDHSAGSRSG